MKRAPKPWEVGALYASRLVIRGKSEVEAYAATLRTRTSNDANSLTICRRIYGGDAMSIALMTLVWKVPFPTSTQMVLALKLADHAKDDGSDVYPGRSSLAERARCSESTVKTTLKLFRECGLLVVVEQGGTKGPHHTTKYRMNVGLLEAIARGEVSMSGSSDALELCHATDTENKGSEFDPLEFYPVSQQSLPGQPAVANRVASPPQTINNHKEPPTRAKGARSEVSKSGFGSEVAANGYTITKTDYPDEVEAWRRYALHRGGHAMRNIVRLIDTHGFAIVPSLMPPDEGLSEKSKRMSGEAA